MIMMRNILENQGRSMCIECVRTSTASVIMSSKMMAPTAAAAKLAASCTVQRTCMTAAHSRHCWPRLRATCPAASTADCHPRTGSSTATVPGRCACLCCLGTQVRLYQVRLHLPVLHTATICTFTLQKDGGQAAELRSKQLDIISPPGFLFPIYSMCSQRHK